jgi:GNAT superfamily N-acetyltransferase
MVGVDSVQFELGGAGLARDLLDPICRLYDDVFSVPPFFWPDDESQLHRDRLRDLFGDPSFGIVVATRDGVLIGFAYGVAVPGGSQRWSWIRGTVDADTAREWPGRTFLLFDYAVTATARGQGIGRSLHDRLLGSRSEERATLTVQPTAMDTKRLYEGWGWKLVGAVDGGPGSAGPDFEAYILDPITGSPVGN